MLEQPGNLTDWERDRIRLDFALFVAKRSRRYQVEQWQIIAVVESSYVKRRATQPATEKAADAPPEGEAPPDSPAPIGPEAGDATPQAPEANEQGGNPVGANDGLTVETFDGIERETVPGKSTRAKAFVAPPGEQSERTAAREQVAALHAAEPWLAPHEAAARLLIPVVNLRIFSQELDIEWSQPRPSSSAVPVKPLPELRTLREKVTAMHRMHPAWTARLIANALGAPHTSVSSYLAGARRVVAEERARAAA